MADEVRLIDGSKIEIFLHQMRYAAAKHGMDYDVEIINIILETVEHEPTIEAEPVNGWISVDDRLPELYKNVLTIDSEGKIFINWLEDIIEMKGYFAYGGGTVTHWQHLPKPPKGE